MSTFVISGNRRGLGQALTQHLRSLGDSVHGYSSQAEPPDRVDASNFQAVQAWVRALPEIPDFVVANAAIVLPPRPLWEIEPDQWVAKAAATLLALGPSDSGKSLSV